MNQLFIALFGLTAVYLTQQHRDGWKRYACLFGLAGQPFWLYFAFSTPGAYGVQAIVLAYSYLWGLGVYNNWIRLR